MRRSYGGLRRISHAGLVVLVGLILSGLPGAADPARAAGCVSATGTDTITHRPWANRWLAPERVWPFSQAGAGVKVAVVDTGVDAQHAQLNGAVQPGIDLVQGRGDGRLDCAGHGTAVASLIAGRPTSGVGFVGMAPRAQILPVRVAERGANDIDPNRVAQGIRWAIAKGATIINVSLTVADHKALRSAVADAVKQGIVVVATAGEGSTGSTPTGSPFPAGYDGVLGVRSTGEDGAAPTGGWPGAHVDLAAPGEKMITVAPMLGHTVWSGGDMAAAVVSGSAALVRAGYPKLAGAAVAERLILTADPAPGGPHSTSYGYGYVNPYRAMVTPELPGPVASRPAGHLPPPAADRPDTRVADASIVVAGVLLAATILLVLALSVNNRRRAAAGGQPIGGPPAAGTTLEVRRSTGVARGWQRPRRPT